MDGPTEMKRGRWVRKEKVGDACEGHDEREE